MLPSSLVPTAVLMLAAAGVAAADRTWYAAVDATAAQPHGAFRPYALTADAAGGTAGSATADPGFAFAPRLRLGTACETGGAELSCWWFRQSESASTSGFLSPALMVNPGASGNGTATVTESLRAVVVDLVARPPARVVGTDASHGWRFDGGLGVRYLDLSARQGMGFAIGATGLQDDRTRTWGLGPVLALGAAWRNGGLSLGVQGSASLLRAQIATTRAVRFAANHAYGRDSEARVASTVAFGPVVSWTARSFTVTASYEFARWNDVLDDRDYATDLGISPAPRDVRWDVLSLGAAYTF